MTDEYFFFKTFSVNIDIILKKYKSDVFGLEKKQYYEMR